MGKTSRLKLLLYFTFVRLYLRKLLLQSSSATLRILRDTNRCFVKLIGERHAATPRLPLFLFVQHPLHEPALCHGCDEFSGEFADG
jgi:hypothetical protein